MKYNLTVATATKKWKHICTPGLVDQLPPEVVRDEPEIRRVIDLHQLREKWSMTNPEI